MQWTGGPAQSKWVEYDAEGRALSVVGRSWAGALVFGLLSLAVRLLLATWEQRWQCDWPIRLMSTRQQPLQQCYIMWWVAGALAFLLLPVVVRLLCRALLATWEQRWQCDWPILSAREKVRYYVTIKHLRVRARGDITCEFEYIPSISWGKNKNRIGMSILTSEPFMAPSFLYPWQYFYLDEMHLKLALFCKNKICF